MIAVWSIGCVIHLFIARLVSRVNGTSTRAQEIRMNGLLGGMLRVSAVLAEQGILLMDSAMRVNLKGGRARPGVEFEDVAAKIGLDKTAGGRGPQCSTWTETAAST
jgi:hypothetical protein